MLLEWMHWQQYTDNSAASPPSCANSGSISLIDSDGASVAGIHAESPSTTIKKIQVGSFKPVTRSVNSSSQESRITQPSKTHSTSPVWSYHSNWSDYLSPLHIIPPYPPNVHQSQLGLGCLENASPRLQVPLDAPEMSSPNISNTETGPLGFG